MVDFAKDQAFQDWLLALILNEIAQFGALGGAYLAYASGSGTQNNVDPGSGWPVTPVTLIPYSTLDVSLAGGSATWTGLKAGLDDQWVVIRNNDAANNLTLNNAGGGSAAANRFSYPANLILPPRATAIAVYRTTPALWYLH